MSRQTSPSTDAATKPEAWWRFPMVWLVVGGPAVVVVASFVTLALAILNPDPVLDTRVPGADELDHKSASMLPALQGRNQAATVAMKPQSAQAGSSSKHE